MNDNQLPLIVGFKGLNNRALDASLPDGALRTAINIDLDNQGAVRTRQGARLVTSGSCHSFWGHSSTEWALCVIGGFLCRLAGSSLVSLRAVQPLSMCYAELDGYVYFSNGVDQGRVSSSGVLDYWGINTPPAPVCTPITLGGLRAGTVRIVQTAIAPSGFESGASSPVAITIPEGGGVSVTVPTGASFFVYATDVDGDVFRQVGGMWTSGTSFVVGKSQRGKVVESLFASRPPAGGYLAEYMGRIWIANGSVLWFTDSKSPHWVFQESGYFQFDAPIVLLAAVNDGLFVGTAQDVSFMQGTSPSEMVRKSVWLRGAVESSSPVKIPSDILSQQPLGQSCAWIDLDGVLCLGRSGGVVQPIGADAYRAGKASRVSLSYFEHDGLRQIAGVLLNAERPNTPVDMSVVSVT